MSEAAAWGFVEVCTAIFVVYWIVAAFWAKRAAERPVWWRRWPLKAAICIALVQISGLLSRRFAGTVLWRYTPANGLAAIFVTGVGLIVVIWARATLAGNWSADVEFKENHELIERGPYHYVRHPIYSGLLLMAVGVLLLMGTPLGFLLVAGALIVFWVKLSQEERLLTRHFPDEYPRYKARVKALVPFVL